MQLENHIINKRLNIIVKPNSPKSEITGWDEEKQALKVNIDAEPEKGKANIEVIKFFTRLLKSKVSIVSGLTSKRKTLIIG